MDILAIIAVTLFLALVINIVLKKINLPTIIGYIVTGVVITYSFNFHADNQTLMHIAEFGIVFLMFSIGLEFSVERLKQMRYLVFVIGSAQILITGVLTYLIALFLFGLSSDVAVIISLLVPLSSTAIVLKTLNKNGDINKKYGNRSLAILLMQDLAVIPILLVIGLLASTDETLSSAVINILIGGGILLVVMFFIAKYLLEPFLTQVVKTGSDELFIITILFLTIGASYLAYAFGFSYSLGAFIGGMMIAETKYKHQVLADLVPFRDILLGLFFITVGMQINFAAIYQYIDVIALVLLLVLILKFFVIYAIVRINANRRVSIKTAMALVQIGEFSLASLELIRTNGLLGEKYSQIMLIVIIISMIITPIILKNITKIADIFTTEEFKQIPDFAKESLNHVIIVGFHTLGQTIACKLKENNIKYIAIDNNIDTYHKQKDLGEDIIFGNAGKKVVVQQAKISEAKAVIVAINNPEKLHSTCHNLLHFVDKSKIVVKLHSESEREKLADLDLEPNNIIVENDITSEQILKSYTLTQVLVRKFRCILYVITVISLGGCYNAKPTVVTNPLNTQLDLQVGDIIVTHKDFRNPISWWGHSAIMVNDTHIGEYPKIFDGYYETDAQFWMQNRDVKTVLRYKNFDATFQSRLVKNINQLKDRKYKITHKTDSDAFYCSQYIWYVYWKTAQDLGYNLDIDKNDGYFVMPYDLINKKYFEEL